jgi:integrase/recombinase XerD
LAGYRAQTRVAYTLDLRQFTAWCLQQDRRLFDVRRVDIECFAREMEDRGKARATVARRLCTICGFYRYAEEEGVIKQSPAVHIRRPRVDYESHVVGPDRNDVGALLVAAGLSSPRDHALVSLFALNGLRVSEAVGVDIDNLGLERGHRTLTVLRKGDKTVTMPLAPRVARAMDLVIGDRTTGPVFLGADGVRLDRHAAGRIVRRIARWAGIVKRVGPHTLRHVS